MRDHVDVRVDEQTVRVIYGTIVVATHAGSLKPFDLPRTPRAARDRPPCRPRRQEHWQRWDATSPSTRQ